MLVVSDLHLAKAEHFRANGLAVPPTVDFQTLSMLTALARRFRPETLLFLGDLFHSAPNRAWSDFKQWLAEERQAGLKEAILVRGNHDRATYARYAGMGLEVVERWEGGEVVFTHEPSDEIQNGTKIHLCGHVHPAIRLRGSGRQTLRVPCFVQTSTGCEAGWRLTLPAFGAFTGMHTVKPRRGVEVFAVSDSSVMGPWRSTPGSEVSRPS